MVTSAWKNAGDLRVSDLVGEGAELVHTPVSYCTNACLYVNQGGSKDTDFKLRQGLCAYVKCVRVCVLG